MTLRNRNTFIAVPRVNWSDPLGVEVSFRTSIFTSRDGTEQREATRQRPRLALKYTTRLTRPEITRHQSDMINRQEGLWAVRAEWTRSRLTAAHVSGGDEIVVDGAKPWMLAGQQIILETEENEDLFTIDSVAGNTITLTDTTARDYPAGTKVFLSYWCRAASAYEFNALTSRVWQAAIRYEVDPGAGAEVPFTAPSEVYEGAYVLLDKPNWRDEVQIGFMQERDVLDPGVGRMTTGTGWDNNVLQFRFSLTGMSRDHSERLIDFFKAVRGRQKSFWVPTWTDDIQPSDDQIGGAQKFKVEGEDFRAAYEDHAIFNTMIAFFPDGTKQINRVANITGTTDSEVGCEDDWDQEINSQTRIYWLVKARMDSDTLDIRWMSDENVEVEFPMRSLPTLYAE